MLQSGHFVVGVHYDSGDRQPNLVGQKQLEQTGLGKGCDCGVCNADVLLTRLSVKDGRIVLPACPSESGGRSRDGMSDRVPVLPESKRMAVEVVEKISELVKAGAAIVGSGSGSDPGLDDYPACDAQVLTHGSCVWGA